MVETKCYKRISDVPPQGDDLLPWSSNSPPYKTSDDVPKLVNETKHVDATVLRLVHGIMENNDLHALVSILLLFRVFIRLIDVNVVTFFTRLDPIRQEAKYRECKEDEM
ncbi:hypothetical protein HAX54_036621 [Datura stramonium]|uniref:Uncharacterized protein n=1 Tax=Datura stramonium TaxID=4076 RepID=A0ABS8VL43_DATST|nr:hypothetical protein [Datura stramonium]